MNRTSGDPNRAVHGPISRLFSSSKAIVVMAITSGCFVALFMGKATFEEVGGLMKWVIGPWLLAVGIEDAAKHNAARRSDNTTASVVVEQVSGAAAAPEEKRLPPQGKGPAA